MTGDANRPQEKNPKVIKFIDLFAGMGGFRLGFENAAIKLGLVPKCVFTSEIKPHARKIYSHNFDNSPTTSHAEISGDITLIKEDEIPDFDYLLAGFPCQAFSSAGKKLGFDDTRGTLFFDIARILSHKKPDGFILENVDFLERHDGGKTFTTIVDTLQSIGYHVTTNVLDSLDFGVPQQRKRIFIVGHLDREVNFDTFDPQRTTFGEIREQGLETYDSEFTERVLSLYSPEELHGKKFKDKRGGDDNIHSWDLELRGPCSIDQKIIMRRLLKQRRRKSWAEIIGIKWMDGMPLTTEQIHTFCEDYGLEQLQELLDDLTEKTYLSFEHPKQSVNGKRIPDKELPKGYNIVTGKLSFELNKIFSPDGFAPTIVATEGDKYGVIDGGKIRRMSVRESLRFFGFPESYQANIKINKLYDLVGNTVVVPVVEHVACKLLALEIGVSIMNEEHNLESKRIYDKLISEKDKLIGNINLSLGGLKIRVKEADSVGNLLQEWFGEWAQKNRFQIKPQQDTQVFPDFYVGVEEAYLEVKAWRKRNSPAFDIANFDSYCESILTCPERIYADYLIFSYEIDDDGNLTIEDVYLKKIWEITTKSGNWPLKVQDKRKVLYNIRPANWVAENAQYKPFEDKDTFVSALFDTKVEYSGVDKRGKFLNALQAYDQ